MSETAKSMSDEMDRLARDLRQGAGREMREEAATDEELTELQRRRRHDMAATLRSAMHSGDRVTVAAGSLTLGDPLVAVGDDYLTMIDGSDVIDVALDGAVVTIEPRSSGGSSGRPSARTLRARLAEIEQEGGTVEVLTRGGLRMSGLIGVTATDHVVIDDPSGARTLVPYRDIAVVFSRCPPRRD